MKEESWLPCLDLHLGVTISQRSIPDDAVDPPTEVVGTLSLTDGDAETSPHESALPYPHLPPPPVLAELREAYKAVAPLTFTTGRVSEKMLRACLATRPSPRVVVSGPAPFLQSVGAMLQALGVPRDAVVTLKA